MDNNENFKKQILEVAQLYLDAIHIDFNKEAEWWFEFENMGPYEEIEAIRDVRKEREQLKSQEKDSEYNPDAAYRKYLLSKKFHSELLQAYKAVGLDQNDFFALTDIGCDFRLNCYIDFNRTLYKIEENVNLVNRIDFGNECPLQKAKESILKVMRLVAKAFDLDDTE